LRFTLIKNIKKDASMKPILNGLLLFSILYLLADFYVSSNTIGFSIVNIKATLYGNEEEFLDPISASVFLEYLHGQIFFMMMILLTLSAVFARLVKRKAIVMISINIVMLSALGTLLSLGFAYYEGESFIITYIILFTLWHCIALYMTLHSLWQLNFAKSI